MMAIGNAKSTYGMPTQLNRSFFQKAPILINSEFFLLKFYLTNDLGTMTTLSKNKCYQFECILL
jgi:hypothetical protein